MSRKREHGRIISVESKTRGDALAEDAAAGATSITVDDAGDFDEDGGWLTIGGQVIEFSECDDDTGVILLVDPLTAAAEQGDPVQVWSDLYEEVIDYQVALVELDGEYDNPDPVVAEVAEGVGELPEGDRGRAGESCTLHRVSDDEWEVVGVGGRSRKSQAIRFEQDDTYTLTAADITAGTATLSLSHRPIDEALTCVLAGVPQRPTEWAIDYNAQTLTIPLSGWEQAGMMLWVHYAYRKGVATATIAPLEYVIPVTGAVTVSDAHTTAPEDVPPVVVGSPPQFDDASDGSYAELEVYEHPDVSYRDIARATIEHTAVPTSVPAGYGLYARIRYQSLATDMRKPYLEVRRTGATVSTDVPVKTSGTPELVAAAMGSPMTEDFPMVDNEGAGIATFLAEVQPGNSQELVAEVGPWFLNTYTYRHPRMRIFDVSLVLKEMP